MNLLQRVVHRKSFGKGNKERPATSPYANPWGEGTQGENESIILSPTGETPPPMPVYSPTHEKSSFFQRPASNGGLRRSSGMPTRRHSTLAFGDDADEDMKLMRGSAEATRRLDANGTPSPRNTMNLPSVNQQPLLGLGDDDNESAKLMHESTEAMGRLAVGNMPRARQSWLNPSKSTVGPYNEEPSRPPPPIEKDAEVRTRYPAVEPTEDNLFDSAHLANQWSERLPISDSRPEPKARVMTTAQFERYRQEQERLKSIGLKRAESPADDDEDTYEDDDEDEEEKRREQARQRRKQEAHMTVYRQQMMKITGDVMGSQRPGMLSTQSTPNLSLVNDAADAEDEDEDIPLAILQAHGFPNKNRAPGQLNGMSSNPNLRASSQMGHSQAAGSVLGGADGRSSMLPAFARRLPQDPYNYGAAIINPSNRESLAFGSGSQYGGPQRPVAGGLVGVIANEERSRAMRRGSPNANGEYSAMPANAMMGAQPPPGLMNRSSMMGGPMMHAPGMNGAQYSADPAIMQAQMAQMQAQLQQSMEMQLQFFNMVAGAPPPPMPGMGGSQAPGSVYGMPPAQQGFTRASTMGNMSGMNSGFLSVDQQSRPGTANNGRPFTVADPNFASASMRNSFMPMGGKGYANSITPSERSNIGQPGRYRPVSYMPQSNIEPSRTSTMMSGAGGGWNSSSQPPFSSKVTVPTVKILQVEREAEDDEEKGWEEMRKKREKKKSMWKQKRQDNDFGDVAHLTH